MKKEIYNLEGIEIEVEKYDKNDKDACVIVWHTVLG